MAVKGFRIGNERGVILPLVAVSWTALLAATAIGIGVGQMTLASTEVQNAADVAALAGASAVFKLRDPEGDAVAALAVNEIAKSAASAHLQELTVGNFDRNLKEFVPNGDPPNSVMARVRATIDNPFGGLIKNPFQDVEKIAYAALSGLTAARPTMPLVIGECNFVQDCVEDWCMPRLTMVPNGTDTAAWTGFFKTASANNISSYVAAAPGCGGGGDSVLIRIGDIITLNNGQVNSSLKDVECAFESGIEEFIIPVVSCQGNYNQSKEVLGFTTIIVENVKAQGNPKGIDLRGIFKSDARGVLGGPIYGTGNIALVPVN